MWQKPNEAHTNWNDYTYMQKENLEFRIHISTQKQTRSLTEYDNFATTTHSTCEYRVAPHKNGTVDTVHFSGLCSDQQLSFFTLLDRASFPHYNNTKIIKFGWELFILWVISYGLSFSGFAWFFQSSEARLMTASAADAPTHTSIQPATKKSQCQWRAWIVNPSLAIHGSLYTILAQFIDGRSCH